MTRSCGEFGNRKRTSANGKEENQKMGVNKCVFHGRFTADPEIQRSASGFTYIRFSLAVNTDRFDKATQQWVGKVDFLPFIAYDEVARQIAVIACKGMPATIEASAEQTMYRAPGKKDTRKDIIFRVQDIDLDEGYKKKWSSKHWI